MKGERLGEFEELILLAVRHRGNDAHGVDIQETLDSEAGRPVSLGAIYTALDRLARKGFVTSRLAAPTAVRGGRRKRHYRVTRSGLTQLAEMQDVRRTLWEGANPSPRGAGS